MIMEYIVSKKCSLYEFFALHYNVFSIHSRRNPSNAIILYADSNYTIDILVHILLSNVQEMDNAIRYCIVMLDRQKKSMKMSAIKV